MERKDRITFRTWLESYHKNQGILLREHPTVDRYVNNYLPIAPMQLARIAKEVLELLSEGWTVVVMDSGGVGRTKEVCDFLKATRISQSC